MKNALIAVPPLFAQLASPKDPNTFRLKVNAVGRMMLLHCVSFASNFHFPSR